MMKQVPDEAEIDFDEVGSQRSGFGMLPEYEDAETNHEVDCRGRSMMKMGVEQEL